MENPVRLELFKEGIFVEEIIANSKDDLNCRIEMLTGTGWLDTVQLYGMLIASGRDFVSDSFRVCNSYEKWGSLRQEVINVKVKMYRVDP